MSNNTSFVLQWVAVMVVETQSMNKEQHLEWIQHHERYNTIINLYC